MIATAIAESGIAEIIWTVTTVDPVPHGRTLKIRPNMSPNRVASGVRYSRVLPFYKEGTVVTV